MANRQFDRRQLRIRPLRERQNKQLIERDHVRLDEFPPALPESAQAGLDETIRRVRQARANQKPVILAFGAHTIKNGLGPILIALIERGWVTHLATNGAGVIHDWEFAYQGQSSEDVRRYVAEGQFGIWDDTGSNINLAIAVGAYEGRGYGESIGALIEHDGLTIPTTSALESRRDGAAADLRELIGQSGLKPGFRTTAHPWKRFSIQAAAFRLGVPFTAHPMFGHDIIYCHPMSCGAAIGRAAERDFLSYAHAVSRLEGGVYLSIGSAVMSPMIFEKSLSMANNVALQKTGKPIQNHFMVVVDLAQGAWDWNTQGEPPPDNPAYYLRYCKTFSRMGGTMRYVSAHNRDFLLGLTQALGG